MPQLIAANVTIPNELTEDCGSDRASAVNATALQSVSPHTTDRMIMTMADWT